MIDTYQPYPRAANPCIIVIMSEQLPDYDVIADVINRSGSESNAAECHGALCALLCVVGGLDPQSWLAMYLEDRADNLPVNDIELLHSLFTITSEQLNSEGIDFQVLQPSDDSLITVRVEALSHWCQGFLLGLGLGGVTDVASLPGDLPELVQDFVKISRADSLELGEENEAESAYAEIVEYLRVGCLMFRQEMLELANPDKDGPPQLH